METAGGVRRGIHFPQQEAIALLLWVTAGYFDLGGDLEAERGDVRLTFAASNEVNNEL
jgi:hypothetical protein